MDPCKNRDMSVEEMVLYRLQTLEATRNAVNAVDTALSLLTPEERLVAQLLLMYPDRGNVEIVCERLNVEQASAYRRRKRVLQKLTETLYPLDKSLFATDSQREYNYE